MTRTTYTLEELASLTGAHLIGDPQFQIEGVDALDTAGPRDATFLSNPRYHSLLPQSKAGVVCVTPLVPQPPGKNLLLSDDPSFTFQKIAHAFFSPEESRSGFTGIHPTAVVHPSARLGLHVHVGPYAVIDKNVVIQDHTVIGAAVYIGPFAHIGSHCHIHPHVTVRERCQIGHRVILQPGAVIGSCGFGFNTNAQGEHIKLEQLGIVVIEDDVEIGANTTIDRARFKTTRIGRGTKIDNLVQIGHNVALGPHNLVVSQTGIAGSVKTGRHVVFGGQAGIVGHIEIADEVLIASRGGVSKSMPKKGKYAGSPVLPLIEHNRQQVHLRKIADYVKQIQDLEERVKQLETPLT
jgi:UDP-3-O-[3-hydroxymyristoyl] glucosamine N-acyltransferase